MTPTPWKKDEDDGILAERPYGRIFIAVMEPGMEDEREFILRAVNSHDALVKALGAIHTAIDELDRMSFGDVPKALDKISTIAFDVLRLAKGPQS